jgi:imidazolonepropionase-like amidohydrolase
MKLIFTALCFIVCSNTFAQRIQYDVVINNVNVIDVNTGKVTPEMIVLIKDGKIEFSNAMMKIPAPKLQIDGTGKYLMQGLYDMHVHFPEQNAERFFQLQTVAGITNSRIMKSTNETVAFSKTAKNIPDLKISYNFFGNETYKIDSVAIIIKSLKEKGYDFIKAFGVKDEAFFDAIMAAAKTNNIIVCGHALGKVPAKKLLASGYRSIEHVGYFDKAKTEKALDSLIDLAIKNNVFVCPTLDWVTMGYQAANKDSFQYRAGYAIGTTLYGKEWDTTYTNNTKQFGGQEKQYKEFADKDVAKKIAILARMRTKGLKIVAGSDAEEPYQVPGFSLIDELKLIQKAGYNNLELVQMATRNAAQLFHFTAAIKGTKVKVSKWAAPSVNFILLSKNPLENIDNLGTVEYVFKGNEVISTELLLERIK